ncbi:MAG: hypothetical protein IIC91_07920 [Chloroflexi bacterium]|nr:hypothetical protein [Chloroflexota bacterium]MCH8008776.1 hypothetical protein [Chloroflexota bacterium]MCH8161048.1 hypothetical protein [Chloroflexota bacterium]
MARVIYLIALFCYPAGLIACGEENRDQPSATVTASADVGSHEAVILGIELTDAEIKCANGEATLTIEATAYWPVPTDTVLLAGRGPFESSPITVTRTRTEPSEIPGIDTLTVSTLEATLPSSIREDSAAQFQVLLWGTEPDLGETVQSTTLLLNTADARC